MTSQWSRCCASIGERVFSRSWSFCTTLSFGVRSSSSDAVGQVVLPWLGSDGSLKARVLSVFDHSGSLEGETQLAFRSRGSSLDADVLVWITSSSPDSNPSTASPHQHHHSSSSPYQTPSHQNPSSQYHHSYSSPQDSYYPSAPSPSPSLPPHPA